MLTDKLKADVLKFSKEGKTGAELRGYLKFSGMDDKDITKALSELGIGRSSSEGLTYPEVLKYLEEKPRTEKEFFQYILEEGTRNEARWINDRNKIRVVINAVFSKYGEKFSEVAATKEIIEKLKEKASKK